MLSFWPLDNFFVLFCLKIRLFLLETIFMRAEFLSELLINNNELK